MRPLEIEAGRTAAYTITMRDVDGNPVTSYAGSETLGLVVWPGDNRTARTTSSCTVAFASASAGMLTLTLDATDTASFETGDTLAVTIVDGGETFEVYRTTLIVRAIAASGTAPTTYCSFADVLDVCGALPEDLIEPTDQAGLAELRHRARVDFDHLIQQHYRQTTGYRRQTTLDHLLDGYPRPYRDGREDSTLQGYLDADGLILTGPSGERAKRWNALRTAAYLYERQMGNEAYVRRAHRFRAEADAIASTLVVGVDSDNDGDADLWINLGLADTIRG